MRASFFARILFALFCLSPFLGADQLGAVRTALEKELALRHPQIIIENIELKAKGLPRDFENYEFLRLGPGRFNAASGFIRAEFKSPQNIQRNIFFRYFLRAKIKVLRAKSEIKRGEKLNNVEDILVDFDRAPPGALNRENANNLIAKTRIKAGAILKENMFNTQKLIQKNDPITGVMSEGSVKISIDLIALESGNLGQTIKAKNKEGKIMRGTIISKNKLILQ